MKIHRTLATGLLRHFSQKRQVFDYVQTTSGQQPIAEQHLPHSAKPLEEYKVSVSKYEKRSVQRGLQSEAIPVSPVLGPIKVEDPKVAVKKYRWCACGMSLKQVMVVYNGSPSATGDTRALPSSPSDS